MTFAFAGANAIVAANNLKATGAKACS